MNYLDKLVNTLKKGSLPIKQFYNLLEKNDTFFDNVELEKELIISNGLPLYFSKDRVYLETANTNIEDQVFCVVDIETSAGNIRDGQIIEIGAVKIKNGKIIEKYESLANANNIPKKLSRSLE
jgi:DNA polymerase-3 subunit epsilon